MLDNLRWLAEQCLDLSMDGAVPEEERKAYLQQAQQLRAALVSLTAAQFNTSSPAYVQAQAQLQKVKTQLEKEDAGLKRAADVVAQLQNLTGLLDGLVKTGASAIV